MDKRKKKILELKGYKVGTVEQFLDLTTEESEYIELKLALSEALAKRRKSSKLTQVQLAKILKSSQSRVAKMEKGDPSVSELDRPADSPPPVRPARPATCVSIWYARSKLLKSGKFNMRSALNTPTNPTCSKSRPLVTI